MENLFSTLTPFRLVGRGDPPLRSRGRLTRERGLNTDRVRQFGGTSLLQHFFCCSIPFNNGKIGARRWLGGRKMWAEFKTFALKGNAFDLAVGVIIGVAFGKIVDGIVTLLIMPIIGAVTGGINFDDYFLALSPSITAVSLADAQKQGAVLGYGAFITIVINFLIVAFVLFQLVKVSNRMRKATPAPPPPGPTPAEALLIEIRDELKKKK